MRLEDYDISTVIEMWKVDGVKYRRGTTKDGRQFVERGEDGRYVTDHVR